MLSRNTKWLFVLLSLVVVATTQAAPTVDNSNHKLTAQSMSPASDADSPSADKVGLFSDTSDWALADIAADFLKPPADFTNTAALLPAQANSLPPVPGALFMVLVGFVCVSLVKDRKLWIAAVTAILWAGQAGFAALPQAASHLVSRKQFSRYSQQQSYSLALEERASRLRCELEGTEYAGLLHHLEGIPVTQMSFLRKQESRILSLLQSLRARRSNLKNQRNTQYAIRDTNKVPQFALASSFSCLIQATICLTQRVQQIPYFSPAFIFENLARGPPIIL